MALDTAALNEAADGIAVTEIRLHSGDPGATLNSNANLITGTETAIVLAAAVGGLREMASPLEIAVPAVTVSHYTLWDGATRKAASAFPTPETFASPGTARITEATLDINDV